MPTDEMVRHLKVNISDSHPKFFKQIVIIAQASQSSSVETADFFRIDASTRLDYATRSRLGQYMTPAPIGRFMASLFSNFPAHLRLLDPGAGVGSLTAAFVERLCAAPYRTENVSFVSYEIDPLLIDYLRETLRNCVEECRSSGMQAEGLLIPSDFIQSYSDSLQRELFDDECQQVHSLTHVIVNPPYKKIHSFSEQRASFRRAGIEATNLYAGFLLIASRLLQPDGEMVAIVPRSFCNGTYFKAFRKQFFSLMGIHKIHVFGERNSAFGDDDVLQENMIIHAVKGVQPPKLKISTSAYGHFELDSCSGNWVTSDMTQRIVDHTSVVDPNDTERVVHIPATGLDQRVAQHVRRLKTTLSELDIEVSTGPVVDFRLKEELRDHPGDDTVPLLYGTHFSGGKLIWPRETSKSNAIRVTDRSRKWLWDNHGYFVVTRRMTSKEERRRIVAYVYSSQLPSKFIGFENHLNVFHSRRRGLSKDLAEGLCIYLNSSLIDRFFRQFSGHTQVNVSDLRKLPYPGREILMRIGRTFGSRQLIQREIDEIIQREITHMESGDDPILAQRKIDDALEILKAFGMPRAQQNDRSALTLLALLDIKPSASWKDSDQPMIGITPIMEYARQHYGRDYAPNTRETFRRQTMHQFVQAGIAIINPDEPDRPINSPNTRYQVSDLALQAIRAFGTEQWKVNLDHYLREHQALAERHESRRQLRMIPVQLPQGAKINLTPGEHSELIGEVISGFAPRFAPGSAVIYVGDTGDKTAYFERQRLRDLGIVVDIHGKMPDLILHYPDRNWIMLIEAVTSHGPVDPKMHNELATLFAAATSNLVYVSAFPNRSMLARHLGNISWETEVWCADTPDHLIHFDGESFLSPYKS